MQIEKTCCFTGRREIPKERIREIKLSLLIEITQAIKHGYTNFISGFAEGADLFAAEIISDLKPKMKNLTLHGAIPYRARLNTKDKNFQNLIMNCDDITVISEKSTPDCYFKRNKFMIENSSLLIAVWDGTESGGTYNTIEYAKMKPIDIRVIKI